ncbi:MAG: serine/threonine-protein kinase PknK, partial [Myxococcales bacterium]|nr:serine/threonine-protein kinase PknK [Myxococcales bacterium]
MADCPHKRIRPLGEGAVGDVHLCVDVFDRRLVVVKWLRAEVHEDSEAAIRFTREADLMLGMRANGLIRVETWNVDDYGRTWMAMEFVDGVSFVEYVRGDISAGQLPNVVRLERALRQLVDGVHHLHLARCVHRDLKPSNVLVTREGRVVILDFGLVSELSEADEGLTRDGQMMGTPAYMAPEQAGGESAGPPADFYALGCMLFECLTGTLPYSGSVLDILIEKRHGKVPEPRARLAPGLAVGERAQAMCELAQWAMAPEPDQRPSAKDFLDQLRDVDTSASVASMSTPAGDTREIFVGRQAELAVLEQAFTRVREELTSVTVHLRGNSGQGKSALVGHFLGALRRGGEVVVLRG